MNTILKDRYGNELHVTMLAVARANLSSDWDGQYLTAGNVYAAGFTLAGELAVIDDQNDLNTVNPCEVSAFLGEVVEFVKLNRPFTRAGFNEGDVVPMLKTIPSRHINKGCVWCKNQEGQWIALSKVHLTAVKPHMTAQALTARMKSATEAGTSQVLVVNLGGGAAGGVASGTLSVGSSVSFTPAPEKLDNVVRVEFQPGGKLYTYRLKDGMIAFPGDDAVVVVNNPNYPELKGTKVVRVKEVDRQENLGGFYKYVEHIVSNEEERQAQAEAKRKAALRKLNKKSQQVQEAKERLARLETEFNVMTEEFKNDFN